MNHEASWWVSIFVTIYVNTINPCELLKKLWLTQVKWTNEISMTHVLSQWWTNMWSVLKELLHIFIICTSVVTTKYLSPIKKSFTKNSFCSIHRTRDTQLYWNFFPVLWKPVNQPGLVPRPLLYEKKSLVYSKKFQNETFLLVNLWKKADLQMGWCNFSVKGVQCTSQ